MDSMSRLPRLFSMEPTAWNSRDFATEWKMVSSTAAQMVSSTPMPAQATISPRLEMVEKASTFLPSFWAMAIMLHTIKVNPPMKDTITPLRVPASAGASRISR